MRHKSAGRLQSLCCSTANYSACLVLLHKGVFFFPLLHAPPSAVKNWHGTCMFVLNNSEFVLCKVGKDFLLIIHQRHELFSNCMIEEYSEVRDWCWMRGPSSLSSFMFTPKVFDGVKVRAGQSHSSSLNLINLTCFVHVHKVESTHVQNPVVSWSITVSYDWN